MTHLEPPVPPTLPTEPPVPLGARLVGLVRYPVKGFPGQDLQEASVRPGAGLPLDRVLGVANGTRPVLPGGGWTECQAFVRLTKNPDLPRWATLLDTGSAGSGTSGGSGGADAASTASSVLHLTSPAGEAVRVRLGEPAAMAADLRSADAVLARWFTPGPLGPVRLVPSRHGLFDHQDAVLSLLNLKTIAELSRAAGQPLDPARFRANLHLAGLPAWSEFALVGRRVRLGEVELEVLRPTDRCSATSVDPLTAGRDVNVPALLAAHFGHLCCGVYARVVVGGRLAAGQTLTDAGPAPGAPEQAAEVATAPAVSAWPRWALVTDRVRETTTVTSYWLRDPLASLRLAPAPGQHLRVHAEDAHGPLWRSYTISAAEADRVRITVRHAGPDARMGAVLDRDATGGSKVLVTGPFGDVTLDPADTAPVLLASAGIGITPSVAALRALVAAGSTRPVVVWHIARDRSDLALWDEALEAIRALPGAQAHLFLTRAGDPTEASRCLDTQVAAEPRAEADAQARAGAGGAARVSAGRPSAGEVAAVVRELGAPRLLAHLCGPPGFITDTRATRTRAGVPEAAVRYEVFTSPRPREQAVPPPMPGPFRVRFITSPTLTGDVSGTGEHPTGAGLPDGTHRQDRDIEAVWHDSDGSLLELAESAGLELPAGCRAGACGSCAQLVSAGSTAYTNDPVLPPAPARVLLCCAVPTSDVTITMP